MLNMSESNFEQKERDKKKIIIQFNQNNQSVYIISIHKNNNDFNV